MQNSFEKPRLQTSKCKMYNAVPDLGEGIRMACPRPPPLPPPTLKKKKSLEEEKQVAQAKQPPPPPQAYM